MITTQLLRPESIVVVGASNNVHKPGGAILKNLINGGYQGELRAVNPKETEVQGVPAFADVTELPDTDLSGYSRDTGKREADAGIYHTLCRIW